MLTHRNIRYQQRAVLRLFLAELLALQAEGRSVGVGARRTVFYLPMAHSAGRGVDRWGAMADPVTLAYCPDARELFEIVAQVHPTGFVVQSAAPVRMSTR